MSWEVNLGAFPCPDVAVTDTEVWVCATGAPLPLWRFAHDGTRREALQIDGCGYFPKTNGHTVVYHDGATCRIWRQGALEDTGLAPLGNNPSAISPSGVIAWQTGAGVTIDGHPVASYRPTGVWALRDDHTLDLMDDCFGAAWSPGSGGYAHRIAPGWVAEAPEGGILVHLDGVTRWLFHRTDTKWPRVSVCGSRVAIVSWGDLGLRLWSGTFEEVAELPIYQTAVILPPAPAHLKGVGYFFRDSQQYGDNPDAPCTHSVIVDEPRSLPAEPQPDGTVTRMILGLPCLLHEQISQWWELVDAVYVAAEGDAAKLETDAALARSIMAFRGLAPKPILGYTGNRLFPTALRGTDLLGVQLYLNRGQGAADLRTLAAVQYGLVSTRRVALIGMAFDRLGWFTGAELAALQPVYWEIACGWPTCEYLLLFSDGRPGGTRMHEELRPYHTAMVQRVREAHA